MCLCNRLDIWMSACMRHGKRRVRLPPIWNDKYVLESRSKHFRISEYLRHNMESTDHRTFAANWNELGVHPVQQVIYLTCSFRLLCSLSLSVCLSVCLSFYLSVYLSVGRSVDRSVGLSVCLPACLSVCLSVCLLVCLPVYLSLWSHTHTYTLILTHTPTHTHVRIPYVRQGKGSQRSDALQDTWDNTCQRMPSALTRIGWDGVEQVWYSITNYELYVHVNIYMYVYLQVYTNVHVYAYVCVCECACVWVCIYI